MHRNLELLMEDAEEVKAEAAHGHDHRPQLFPGLK